MHYQANKQFFQKRLLFKSRYKSLRFKKQSNEASQSSLLNLAETPLLLRFNFLKRIHGIIFCKTMVFEVFYYKAEVITSNWSIPYLFVWQPAARLLHPIHCRRHPVFDWSYRNVRPRSLFCHQRSLYILLSACRQCFHLAKTNGRMK